MAQDTMEHLGLSLFISLSHNSTYLKERRKPCGKHFVKIIIIIIIIIIITVIFLLRHRRLLLRQTKNENKINLNKKKIKNKNANLPIEIAMIDLFEIQPVVPLVCLAVTLSRSRQV